MKKSVLFAVIAGLAIALTGCYRFSKSESYFGISTSGKNVVFLVDISGSMEGRNEGNVSDKLRAKASGVAADQVRSRVGGILGSVVGSSIEKESTKLGTAKRELMPAIKGLPEDTKFTIITFESGIGYWNKGLVKADSKNKTMGSLFVDRLASAGGTSALAGLKAALSVSGADMIFFLSDGQPSDGSPDKIIEEVGRINAKRKVVIHSIGLGDDKDEQFMRNLAEANGGIYTEK